MAKKKAAKKAMKKTAKKGTKAKSKKKAKGMMATVLDAAAAVNPFGSTKKKT